MATLGCKAQRHDIDRTTVTSLNVDRYMGRWYEIARYDHRFERGMTHVVADYSIMDDGKITGIGTHDFLLENNVEYGEIYASQVSGKGGK